MEIPGLLQIELKRIGTLLGNESTPTLHQEEVHMVSVTSICVYVHLLHSLLPLELAYLAFSFCKCWTSLPCGFLDEILTADSSLCIFSSHGRGHNVIVKQNCWKTGLLRTVQKWAPLTSVLHFKSI